MNETIAPDAPAIRNRTIPEPFKAGEFISARKLNVLAKACGALLNPQITRGEGDKVLISDSNHTIQIDNSTSTDAAQMFRLKSVHDDYVTCQAWDGANDGAVALIAKEPNNRTSLTGQTVLGTAHTYTYSAGPSESWASGTSTSYNLTRTNSDGISTEDERIVPPWMENEVILAIPATTGVFDPSGVPIKLLMVRSCQWALISS